MLTPENIAKGAPSIPLRGVKPYPMGRWSFETKSGAATGNAGDPYYNGPDGKDGTFKVTYNGERFVSGAWPKEEPPIYPPH